VYREAFPDWSRRFIELSATAVRIREYAAHTVPGLLQTEDYARAVLSVGRTLTSATQLTERVAFRMDRQERLCSDDCPDLVVILDESVLRRPIGSPAVMREQLRRLLATEHDPHIAVQVLPFAAGAQPGMGGSLTVLTLDDGSEVAYTEGADFGQLIDEPEDVTAYLLSYDQLRANALPPDMSLDMLRSTMEDDYRDARLPSPAQRRRLANLQLQQSGGWQLRGGRPRVPRPRPGA
jgi:hypothetical protein